MKALRKQSNPQHSRHRVRNRVFDRAFRQVMMREPELPERKIQIQRAGSHFKARWEGMADFVFGTTPLLAKQRLLAGHLKSCSARIVLTFSEN